ncbi:MAG: DUF481 domain-containing protein [Betaproteobacteria bacterium]|nr:MAG: DUF481 domain-containing protein [Betaproteobacteria bacterium]
MPFRMLLLALAVLAWRDGHTQATATVTPDDRWHFALGAGASVLSGNTESRSLNAGGEAVHMSDHDRFGLYGRTLDVQTPAQRTRTLGAGGQYNRDFSLAFGLGYHAMKTDASTADLTAGLAATDDRYVLPAIIAGTERSRYVRAETILGENSDHKLASGTTLKQKFALYNDQRNRGHWRAEFDGGLSVPMTASLSLTATLNHRYDSEPGPGLQHHDTRFVTGVSMKLD